jgi:SagB-type dehydrogenase family enzyme
MSDALDPQPPDKAVRIFELYHENSKQRPFDVEFGRRILFFNESPAFHEVAARTFKSYPGAEFLALPKINPEGGPPFELVAAMRRSIRRFDGLPLTVRELARLLSFGAGVTGQLDPSDPGFVQPVRAIPSGGALYPIEVYTAIAAVEGIEPGLYHYAVERKGLELLHRGNLVERLCKATADPATISAAAVVFILTGQFARSHFKYGERGYRFALLEAAHISQNLLLEATALDLGAVAIGGFIDDQINAMLDLDGIDETAIYLIAAGRPAARPVATPNAPLIDRVLGALWTR